MKAALGDLRVVHSLPGRTRLKFSELKTHPQRHAHLQQKLTAIAGIDQIDINPTAGSVVLHHDPTAVYSIEFLAKVAAAFGLPMVDATDIGEWLGRLEDGAERATFDVHGQLQRVGRTMNRTIGDVSGGRVDGKILIPTLLLLLGIRSLLICEVLVTPRWYDYFWFAFGTYFMLNKPASGDASP
ncbi:HMA2 domain-containing protein [Nitrospira sp. Nam74]